MITIRPGPGRCCPDTCQDVDSHQDHKVCCHCGHQQEPYDPMNPQQGSY